MDFFKKQSIELKVPLKKRNRVVAKMKPEDSEATGKKEYENKLKLWLNLNLGMQMDDEIDDVGGLFDSLGRLPKRYMLISTTSIAFIICNMDKVNLSIAIIPMSDQFGWNSSTAGLLRSSFFWGYALSQFPGGWLAKLLGGSNVLKIGVLAWYLVTMFVPVAAGFMPGLVLSRILINTNTREVKSSCCCLWWIECWKRLRVFS